MARSEYSCGSWVGDELLSVILIFLIYEIEVRWIKASPVF
jgi:hypothetical protein